jgi:hypothetical protein
VSESGANVSLYAAIGATLGLLGLALISFGVWRRR